MGGVKRAMVGGTTHEKNVELQNKYQKEALKNILRGLGNDPKRAYKELLKIPKEDMKAFSKGLQQFIEPSTQDMMQSFETGVVNPTLDVFQKQVVPGIQERFVGENLGYSSALNNALANAASDVSTQIGSQLPSFLAQQQSNKLSALGLIPGARSQFLSPMTNALSGYGGLLGEQTFQPVISQQSGLGGPLITAAGLIGAAKLGGTAGLATAASSRDVKENIKDYDKGLEEINKIEVKSYDYKDGYGDKNRIGIIAEDAPKEIQTTLNGINAVDLYGIVSLLVNSVKELSSKVERLEAKS